MIPDAKYVRLPEHEQTLWERLADLPEDGPTRDALVRNNEPLVRIELGKISRRIPPHIDREELYAAGLVGLFSAITHFHPSEGVAFASYARKRIWGAMLDRLRSLDGVPRSSRTASRRLCRAHADFLNEHNRHPDEAELAELLGVNSAELHEMERQAVVAQMLSLDVRGTTGEDQETTTLGDAVLVDDARLDGPLDRLAKDEARALLVEGLKSLPDRERAIVVLFYQQELQQKEIALAMKVSESRISQLHNRAIVRLRAFLQRGTADTPQPTNAKDLARREYH